MKNITKKDLTWKFLAKEWPSGYCEYHGDDDFYLESVIDDMIPAPLRPVTNKLRAELRAKYAKVNEGYDDNFLRDLKKSVLYTRTRAAGRGGRDGGILGLFTKKGRLIGHIETGVDGHYQNAGIVAEITNAT